MIPPLDTAQDTSKIREKVRTYIRESFQDEELSSDFGNDEDLLTILDSLQLLRMLIDLEGEYGVHVENCELTPENLGTVSQLADFIAKKQQQATS
jgi:acyl carrier protein